MFFIRYSVVLYYIRHESLLHVETCKARPFETRALFAAAAGRRTDASSAVGAGDLVQDPKILCTYITRSVYIYIHIHMYCIYVIIYEKRSCETCSVTGILCSTSYSIV